MPQYANRRQQKNRRRMITGAAGVCLAFVVSVALVSATPADPDGEHNKPGPNVSADLPDKITMWQPPRAPVNPSPPVGPVVVPTTTPRSEPTTTPTTDPEPTSEPTSPEATEPPPSGEPDVPAGDGSFPTMESTGPDIPVAQMKASDSIATEETGQVIEGLNISSAVKVVHDDVVIRNSRINHTATKSGQYALHIATKSDGSCPQNVVVENIEIVGDRSVLVDTAKTVYAACPFTLRDSRIYDVGNGVRITSGARLEGNFILNNHFVPGSGAHRGGVALNGGSGNVIVGNTIDCEGTGCSGGLVMYGDFAPVTDILIEGNLINTTGSYCTYGGSLDSKKYPKGTNIKYIGNHFGRKYFPTCGRYGVRAGWDGGNEGNEWRGNVWHDTGEIIP